MWLCRMVLVMSNGRHWVYKLGSKGKKDKEHMQWDTYLFFAHSSIHKNEIACMIGFAFFQSSNLQWLRLLFLEQCRTQSYCCHCREGSSVLNEEITFSFPDLGIQVVHPFYTHAGNEQDFFLHAATYVFIYGYHCFRINKEFYPPQ